MTVMHLVLTEIDSTFCTTYRVALSDDFGQTRGICQGSDKGSKDRDPVPGTVQETESLQQSNPVYGNQLIVCKRAKVHGMLLVVRSLVLLLLLCCCRLSN